MRQSDVIVKKYVWELLPQTCFNYNMQNLLNNDYNTPKTDFEAVHAQEMLSEYMATN